MLLSEQREFDGKLGDVSDSFSLRVYKCKGAAEWEALAASAQLAHTQQTMAERLRAANEAGLVQRAPMHADMRGHKEDGRWRRG